MTGLGLVIILTALAAAVCLMTLVARLWSLGGSEQQPVGPLRAPPPRQPPAPIVPGNFRGLITGEAAGWRHQDQWMALTYRLDDLEVSLGGSPTDSPAPDEYSTVWLDQRVRRIEQLTGPLPAPLRVSAQTKKPSRKRWFTT